ncbi:hypothetical protein ACFFSQ_48115, partial [Dactylosporangium matsuzakiense]
YDLDEIAVRLADGADYEGLTALIAADLAPARLAAGPNAADLGSATSGRNARSSRFPGSSIGPRIADGTGGLPQPPRSAPHATEPPADAPATREHFTAPGSKRSNPHDGHERVDTRGAVEYWLARDPTMTAPAIAEKIGKHPRTVYRHMPRAN